MTNQELVDFCIAHNMLHKLARVIHLKTKEPLPRPLSKVPVRVLPVGPFEPISAGEMAGYDSMRSA
jgi:hypothetical protein